ncbi:PilN domain-containing protein [Actinoplanes sp. NPDC026619]|uniref:PilN domain-containing protein n=1 Tax=Actinoplanes sp. NPDC026619 TaxID=3155798 RepID=UPI0033BFB8C2
MSTSSTALMPLDPAVSPDHAMRILPIRANLLPPEVTSGRNARRTRFLLIGAVVLVVAVMGGWYVLADKQRDLVSQDLTSTTEQADTIRNTMRTNKEYSQVTTVINDQTAITTDLTTVLAKDLPWYTLMDTMRSAASKKGGTLTSVSATMTDDTTAASTGTVGSLQIAGTAKDKAAVADVIDALAGVDGVTDVFLTAASADSTNKWAFTITAAVDKDYVCGRFSTKTCGSK